MGNCKYYEICGLSGEADPNEGLCILHYKNPEKDEKAFAYALNTHRKKNGDNFFQMVFPGIADFSKVTFTKDADFSKVTFTKDADFTGVTFTKDADFFEVTFTENTYFSEATFTEGSYFSGAAFIKDADFLKATFTKSASFSKATFTKDAHFSGATFTEGADFSGVIFSNKAYFDGAIFKGKVNFIYSSFRERTLFTPRLEKDQIISVFKDVEVDFRRVIIEKPDAFTFVEADFSECLFQGTNLQKVCFIGGTWRKTGYREGIYDETFLERVKVGSWNQIERLYRDLKKNYEDSRDFERAGHFHYGEKEMRRRNPQTPVSIKFLLTLYWIVSGYSERCVRPLIWLGALLAISTFGYLKLGLWYSYTYLEEWRLTLTNPWDWLQATHYSLQVMALLKPSDLVPMGYAKFIHTIQSILGPILIGLFALAVRQKLKR